jgi:hypothetical protein
VKPSALGDGNLGVTVVGSAKLAIAYARQAENKFFQASPVNLRDDTRVRQKFGARTKGYICLIKEIIDNKQMDTRASPSMGATSTR